MEEEFISVKKNNKKIIVIICILLVILLLGGGGYYYYKNYYQKDNKESTETIAKPRLQDDFYENMNHDTILYMNAYMSDWNLAGLAGTEVDKKKEKIINEILEDSAFKNSEMDAILALYNDTEGRNKKGISDLKKYLDMIDNVKTISELNKVLFTMERDLNINQFWSVSIVQDIEDNTKNIVAIDQARNDIGIPYEYDVLDKWNLYQQLIEKIRNYNYKMLGYDEEKSKSITNEMKEFYKIIQDKSIVGSEVTDIVSISKKYSLDDIKKEIKNLPLVESLEKRGVNKEKYYVVYDIGQLKALDEVYDNDHLPLFKNIAKSIVITSSLGNTTSEADKLADELYVKFANKSEGEFRTEEIDKIREPYIDDELQKRYEKDNFTDEDKQMIKDYITEIKKVYAEIINESDWLSSSTKTEAIKKLNAIEPVIGYQGKKNSSIDSIKFNTKENGGTYMAYIIAKNQKEYDDFSKGINNVSDLNNLSTLTVNAQYDTFSNKMYYYAGYKELYNGITDKYELMGRFGFTVGHEISHAFDENGSQFDENGNIRDWWEKEDREHYNQLSQKIVDYYSKYEYNGVKIDGKKTMSENIADLASMKAMVRVAEANGATKEDYKKMFESFAKMWAEHMTKDMAENMILTETHAPGKIRVNAVLSSTDKFYEVYDIKEGDKMYVPKEERVGLW